MRKSFVCILVVLVMGVLLAVLDPLPSAAKAEIRGILNQASQLEAVGLDPQRMSGDDPALFNGYRPLDQRNLSPEEQRQTVNALNTDFRYRVWEVARSFKPRQALILTTAQGKYRLLLSYECSQMKLVRPDGSQGPLVPLGGSSAGQLQRIRRLMRLPISLTECGVLRPLFGAASLQFGADGVTVRSARTRTVRDRSGPS